VRVESEADVHFVLFLPQQDQKVKVTLSAFASKAADLMINVLNKKSFDWAGGKTVPLEAGFDGLLTVEFTLDGEVKNEQEYFMHALLIPPGGDYTA
jgi:hypothetical protein